MAAGHALEHRPCRANAAIEFRRNCEIRFPRGGPAPDRSKRGAQCPGRRPRHRCADLQHGDAVGSARRAVGGLCSGRDQPDSRGTEQAQVPHGAAGADGLDGGQGTARGTPGARRMDRTAVCAGRTPATDGACRVVRQCNLSAQQRDVRTAVQARQIEPSDAPDPAGAIWAGKPAFVPPSRSQPACRTYRARGWHRQLRGPHRTHGDSDPVPARRRKRLPVARKHPGHPRAVVGKEWRGALPAPSDPGLWPRRLHRRRARRSRRLSSHLAASRGDHGAVTAQAAPAFAAPADAPCRRSLVLSGGGMRLSYQAGVLRALHEAGLSFHHVDATSGGAINLAMLLSGLSPDDMCERWATLQLSRSISLMPLDDYLCKDDQVAMASADGFIDYVYPHLGIDLQTVRGADWIQGKFNVFNYTRKVNEVVEHQKLSRQLFVAGMSLPGVM